MARIAPRLHTMRPRVRQTVVQTTGVDGRPRTETTLFKFDRVFGPEVGTQAQQRKPVEVEQQQ